MIYDKFFDFNDTTMYDNLSDFVTKNIAERTNNHPLLPSEALFFVWRYEAIVYWSVYQFAEAITDIVAFDAEIMSLVYTDMLLPDIEEYIRNKFQVEKYE